MDLPQEVFLNEVARIKEQEDSKKSATATATAPEPENKEGVTIAEPAKTPEAKPDEKAGINDETAIEYLKSKGVNVSSLEELTTKISPKPDKTEEQSLTEALEYGVKNGKIKLEEYNKAVQYKSAPAKDLVYQNFSEKIKERNPKISDEEIKVRFDKKYAASEKIEEIKDELGEVTDRKIVYALDEKEIEADAEELRKQAWTPVETVKKSYSTYEEQQSFHNTVLKEIDGIKTQIPKSVKITLGDNEIFDYEIDPSFEKQVSDILLQNYYNARNYVKDKGLKWEAEKFNLQEAIEQVTWNVCGKNIMQIYGKNQHDAGVLKGLEDFKNPTKKPLETLNVGDRKLPPETEQQIAERFSREMKYR